MDTRHGSLLGSLLASKAGRWLASDFEVGTAFAIWMVSFPGKPSRLGELLGFPEFLIALRRSFSASIFCHGGAGGRNSISCSYGGLFLVRRPGNISASNLHAHVVAV